MIKLVTQKVCPICSMVKNILKVKKMDFVNIDYESAEGKAIAEKYKAQALPIFVQEDNSPTINIFTGHDVIKYLKSL